MREEPARPRHCLSEIDDERSLGTCSVCGPSTPLVRRDARWRCKTSVQQIKRASDQRWKAKHPERYRQGQEAWRKKNIDRRRAYHFERNYGITVEDYDRLLTEQGGVCGLCKGPPAGPGSRSGRFHVDHCHETGEVRGLLCGRCNTAIGLLRHDRDLILAAAAWV